MVPSSQPAHLAKSPGPPPAASCCCCCLGGEALLDLTPAEGLGPAAVASPAGKAGAGTGVTVPRCGAGADDQSVSSEPSSKSSVQACLLRSALSASLSLPFPSPPLFKRRGISTAQQSKPRLRPPLGVTRPAGPACAASPTTRPPSAPAAAAHPRLPPCRHTRPAPRLPPPPAPSAAR